MLKFLQKCSFVVLLFLVVSCDNRETDGKILIRLSDYDEVHAESPFELFEGEPRFIHLLSDEDNTFLFTDIDRIEIHQNKIYIFDKKQFKLLVFREDGNPLFKLDYKGRGPNEYLQITDFDVDKDGNIWIADAQKNRVFKYSDAGKMLESYPYTSEIIKLCCIDDNRFLLGIASWDVSLYAGTALGVADASLSIEEPILSYPSTADPNFHVASILTKSEKSIFYNCPIDDNLYEISYNGELLNTYYFDFGEKTFPEQWRSAAENYLSHLSDYLFLENTYQIAPNHIVCGIRKNSILYSVVMDRVGKTVAFFDSISSGYRFVGACGLGTIWRIDPGCDVSSFPPEVIGWLDNDDVVLAVITDK